MYDYNEMMSQWLDTLYAADPVSSGMYVAAIIRNAILVLLAVCAVCVILSIMHNVGLYTIASRRGIKHPWMAFVPLTEAWLLGSIADQYQYVVWGQIRHRRRVALWLSIVLAAILGVFCAVYINLFIEVIKASVWVDVAAYQGDLRAVDEATLYLERVLGPNAIAWLITVILSLIMGVVLLVYRYICYYNILVSCRPKCGVVFLVLGILFFPLMQLFVFICRKRDFGMPPKKTDVQPDVTPMTEVPADMAAPAVEEAVPAVEEAPVAEEAAPAVAEAPAVEETY